MSAGNRVYFLATSQEHSLDKLIAVVGIEPTTIWEKGERKSGPKDAFPGSGHQTVLEEENRRLKRDLERVQQERDILKKW